MTENADDSENSDLREFLGPIWTRKWLILFIVVVATALTYIWSARKPNVYTATARVFLQGSQSDRNTADQAALLQTQGVARRVAARVHYAGDPQGLLQSVQVAPSSGSDFMTIAATAGRPQRAATLANGFAQAFIDLQAEQNNARLSAITAAQRQLNALTPTTANRASRDALQQEISNLLATPVATATQTNQAVPPTSRSAPRPLRSALFGFGISLALAVLAAFGLVRFDRLVRHLNQVEPAFHLPLLAALPNVRARALKSRASGALQPTHPFREMIRGLRINLQLTHLDDPLRTFLVSSAGPSEGKSTVVCHLAIAYQEAGLRVVVVECDLRRPSLASRMEVNPSPGLTEVLAGECSLSDALQVVNIAAPAPASQPAAVGVEAGGRSVGGPQGAGMLTMLTSGSPVADPATLLGTSRMRRILESLREASDLVIIDATPLLAVADALPLLPLVDGALLVARLGVVHRSSGRRIEEVSDRIPGATLLGVVANDVPDSELEGSGYGYGYGYQDGGRPAAS